MRIYTTKEAAAALGVSTRRVQQACSRDGIGRKHGRDLLLTDADIEYMRSRRGKVGKPGINQSDR